MLKVVLTSMALLGVFGLIGVAQAQTDGQSQTYAASAKKKIKELLEEKECPKGAKRNPRNGHCYFSPLCSPANKGLPGTDQCE